MYKLQIAYSMIQIINTITIKYTLHIHTLNYIHVIKLIAM
jgi:hypothetical protein